MDIEGDLAGILSLSRHSKKAVGLSPDDLVQIKLVAGKGGKRLSSTRLGYCEALVAGTGFEPVTFRL